MKTTILVALIALVSIAPIGRQGAADAAPEAPIRIHQPSAIEQGIGVAPSVPAPAPTLPVAPSAGIPGAAC